MVELTEAEEEAIEGLEDEAEACVELLFDARMDAGPGSEISLAAAQKSAQAVLDGITAIIEAH